MPSSISSSEPEVTHTYERSTPVLRFGLAGLVAMVVFATLLGTWEQHWRNTGAGPSTVNSDGLWAMQRRRVDEGEGNATVLIGSSRMLFDFQLEVWERLDGTRPIQLALEGTTPVPVLEDLAADTNFTGRLFVGVAPDLFFSGFAYRAQAIATPTKETPAQRSGQWLAMHLLEPHLAFLEPDFSLFVVLARQAWPAREGVRSRIDVRKLDNLGKDRNSRMWARLETDSAYRALAQRIWAQNFGLPPGVTPAMADRGRDEQLARAVKAVSTLKARGVQVVFVRFPSADGYYAFEQKAFPRESTWDALLAQTGVPGVHFEDHPELQGFWTPEWSHLSASEADRYTAALYPIMKRALTTPTTSP